MNLYTSRTLSILPMVFIASIFLQGCALTIDYANASSSTSHVSSSATGSGLSSYTADAEEKKLLQEAIKEAKTIEAQKSDAGAVPHQEQTVAPVAEVHPIVEPVVTEPARQPVEVTPAETSVPAPPAYVAPIPVVAAPPVPVQQPYVAPAPVAPPAQDVRSIYVGLSGMQETVDRCQGPVLFLNSGLPYPYIAEHENCGGWGRIGSLKVGTNVSLSGLVGGNYTVGQVIRVKKHDTTDALTFASQPRAILQTCIPGSNQMLVFALY